MITLLQRITLLTMSLMLLLVGGCSKQGKPEPTANSPTDSKTASQPAIPAASPLPAADAATPLSAYNKITGGNQLMFLYYALANMPVDYEKIAQSYSQEYRSTNDEFKKKDLLNALKPRIDSEITKAKAARYISVDTNYFSIGHYDFTAKGFPIGGVFASDRYGYFSDNSPYTYTYTNGDAFQMIKVADEAKAREIEGMIGKTQFRLTTYLFAQDTDPNHLATKCQIVKIVLTDNRGQELLTQ